MPGVSSSTDFTAIVRMYNAKVYTNYITAAGYAFIVADFLQTFPEEVRLMWPAPFGLPKVMFFAVRYYLLISNVFSALDVFPTNYTIQGCRRAFHASAISCVLILTGVEVILFLRVYAFGGRSRNLLGYLMFQFLAIHAAIFSLIFKFLTGVEFKLSPLLGKTHGHVCTPIRARSFLIGWAFAGILANVAAAMVIMAYLAFVKHRGMKSRLLTVFYRDGVFYFVCLAALTSVNMFVNFAAPDGYQFLFIQLEVALQGILSTRMLIHLRDTEYHRMAMMDPLSTYNIQGNYGGRAPSPLLFEQAVELDTKNTTSPRCMSSSSFTSK